jgi:hypothetical protein
MTNKLRLGILAGSVAVAACSPKPELDDSIEGNSQELSGKASLVVVSSAKCVDVPGNSIVSGVQLDQWSCGVAGKPNQTFTFKGTTSAQQIVNVGSGLCLDVKSASTADGAAIIQYACNSTKTNQQWKAITVATNVYRFQSVRSGKCLTIAGNSTASGALLEQRTCSSTAKNQQFKFTTTTSGGTGGTGGTSGGGTGGTSGGGGSDPCASITSWKTANKTWYTSYPAAGSEECIKYSGCQYEGQFSVCSSTKSESWVRDHNIVAFFPDTMGGHDLCLKSGSKTIVVRVLDTCGDKDCGGCCTENQGSRDALIDIESYTNKRFGVGDGVIQWADLGKHSGDICQ